MEDDSTPLVTFDLGEDNGGARHFYSAAELKQWVGAQHTRWEWLRGSRQPIGKAASSRLDRLRNAARQLPEDTDSNPDIRELQGAANELFGVLRMPLADSPTGEFILLLREQQGAEVAAGALAYFLPQSGEIQLQNRDALRGLQLAVLYQAGLYESVESERRSLAAMRARWERTLSEQQARAQSLGDRLDNLRDVSEATITKVRDSGARALRVCRASHRKVRTESVERLTQLEETFREKLALRAPVEYWTTKGLQHRHATIGLGLAVVVTMTFVALFLFQAVVDIVGIGEPQWWQLAALGIGGVLGVWAIRIVVRLFLSNLHLAADAAERAVMVNVYLSLMEDQRSGVTEEDRRLILQALFRPSATGIVRDDATPPGAIELITRAIR